jgi:hypothetical protein
MEAADRIRHALRVLLDGGGDPGMGKLEQERATCSQEDCGLPVDAPGLRFRAEDACQRTSSTRTHQVQLALQAIRADYFESVLVFRDVHRFAAFRPLHSISM